MTGLSFLPSAQAVHLLAPTITQWLQTHTDFAAHIQVAEIDPAHADGQLLHEHYGVPLEMELNCIVVQGTRGDRKSCAALVLPYGTRANTGSAVKQILDAKKVSFAPLDETIAATGMEFGSITPVGLPENWLILIDETVLQRDWVIIGGGLAKSKIRLPAAQLAQLPNARIVAGLAKA